MNASSLSFQDIILRLQQYWGEQGCVIMQPYDCLLYTSDAADEL